MAKKNVQWDDLKDLCLCCFKEDSPFMDVFKQLKDKENLKQFHNQGAREEKIQCGNSKKDCFFVPFDAPVFLHGKICKC